MRPHPEPPARARPTRRRTSIEPTADAEAAASTALVKSADRVLDLLELMAGTGRPMSHSELARRTGIPKSSLTQLLRTLAQRGYAEQSAAAPHFQLGERAYALARRGAHSRDLVMLGRPWLERLMHATGESAGLSVLRDDLAERVASVETRRAVLYSMHVGVMAPLYANSAGKVLLAWMPADEREAYLRRVKLEARTEQTIRSVAVLRRQLQGVRDEGVAWSIGEFTAGITGIAVPVLDAHGRAMAAVGVALPSDRLDDDREARILRALRSAAAGIARDVEDAA